MVQVLYLLEVFILGYYGPPSTKTPTTTIVWWNKNSWIYLTSTYLLLVTFETNDNFRFDSKFQIIAQLFDSKWKKHYSHSTTCYIWKDLFPKLPVSTHKLVSFHMSSLKIVSPLTCLSIDVSPIFCFQLFYLLTLKFDYM